jgi:hypothetical protein
METVLHTMYVVAIKDTAAWDDDTAAELSMIGFWNLIVVWLKVRGSPMWRCSASAYSLIPAAHSLAILPPLGVTGRDGPARKHGSMRVKQLLDPRILAIMAPIV